MNDQSNQQRNWWLGVLDMAAEGAGHGALKLERVHLAIADESFGILERIPVTRPWARVVRTSHHGLTRLCYGAVRVSAQGVGYAVSALSPDAFRPLDQDQDQPPSRAID